MKIKVNLSIGFVQGNHEDILEVPDSEIEGMSGDELEDYILTEHVEQWANNHIEYSYEEIKS